MKAKWFYYILNEDGEVIFEDDDGYIIDDDTPLRKVSYIVKKMSRGDGRMYSVYKAKKMYGIKNGEKLLSEDE